MDERRQLNETLGAVEQLPRERQLKFSRGRWLIALVLIGAAGGAYWLQRSEIAPIAIKTSAAPEQIPVVAGPAAAIDLPIWLSGVGAVQPLNVVTVKVRVDGQIDRVDFEEGQYVKAGDLLAQIDPRPFQAALKRTEATRLKDQAQLNNAKVDLERYAKLASTGSAPSQQVDTLKAQVAALEATIAADQADIDSARLQFEFATITSPVAGRVGFRLVDPGSIVHASDAGGLVTITQIDPISAVFSLPQDNLQDVLAGFAKGSLQVDAYSRDGGQRLATGELVFVDSQIDATNGMFKLRANFANGDHALWPGQFISARVLLRTDRNVTATPARAIQRGQDRKYVYVVKPDKTVAVQTVETGPTIDGVTVVTSGLSPGDEVVFDGQSRLSPRASVSVKPAPGVTGARQ